MTGSLQEGYGNTSDQQNLDDWQEIDLDDMANWDDTQWHDSDSSSSLNLWGSDST